MTVGEMLTRNANKFPTKKAIISEEAALDFKTLNDRVAVFRMDSSKKASKKETGLAFLFIIVISF